MMTMPQFLSLRFSASSGTTLLGENYAAEAGSTRRLRPHRGSGTPPSLETSALKMVNRSRNLSAREQTCQPPLHGGPSLEAKALKAVKRLNQIKSNQIGASMVDNECLEEEKRVPPSPLLHWLMVCSACRRCHHTYLECPCGRG
jgi:hypothetical protein